MVLVTFRPLNSVRQSLDLISLTSSSCANFFSVDARLQPTRNIKNSICILKGFRLVNILFLIFNCPKYKLRIFKLVLSILIWLLSGLLVYLFLLYIGLHFMHCYPLGIGQIYLLDLENRIGIYMTSKWATHHELC